MAYLQALCTVWKSALRPVEFKFRVTGFREVTNVMIDFQHAYKPKPQHPKPQFQDPSTVTTESLLQMRGSVMRPSIMRRSTQRKALNEPWWMKFQ